MYYRNFWWFQREGRWLNRFVEPDLPTQDSTEKCKPENAQLTPAQPSRRGRYQNNLDVQGMSRRMQQTPQSKDLVVMMFAWWQHVKAPTVDQTETRQVPRDINMYF